MIRRARDVEPPEGGFRFFMADPPWEFKVRSAKGLGRSPQRHYRCMPTAEIQAWWHAEGLDRLMARDVAGVMWATWPMLLDAIAVIEAWGFRYKTGFPWIKTSRAGAPIAGTGHIVRGATEPVLIVTRGSPKVIRPFPRGLIEAPVAGEANLVCWAPRRGHSQKPDDLAAACERAFAGPRLELFGRAERPGWTVLGDQVGKFAA